MPRGAVGRRVYGACGGDRLEPVALTDDAGADALAPLVDVPGPSDVPKPDDEPDDETDDEADEERDDEPDNEGDDEPEPGTLYFGENDGWTARSCCSPPPRPSRQAERAPWAQGSDFSTTRSMPHDCLGPSPATCCGAERVSLGKRLP